MPHTTGPLTSGTSDPASPRGRRARARALAVFFSAGAGLGLMGLALPGWEATDRPATLALVGAALTVAAALYVLSDHIATRLCHLSLPLGYLTIAVGQVLAGGGNGTTTYAMLYVWVALYAGLFFDRRAILAHLGGCTLVHVAALTWLGTLVTELPTVLFTLGTQLTAALIVRRLVSALTVQAETDDLTGLGNRQVFDRALRQALAVTARDPARPVCVAALDLDGFKAFNDTAGHLAGDRALQEAAARWRALTRDTDTLTRVGGDEFLLVLVDSDVDDARRAVQRLIDQTPDGVGCSAGIAQWNGYESTELLVGRVDRALYSAKRNGPVQVAVGAADIAAAGR